MMISIFVKYSIKEDYCEDFFSEVVKHSERCLKNEKGCLLFHVSRSAENSKHFLLYEMYEDAFAVTEHRASMHYKKYCEYVKGWVMEKRVELAVKNELQ